MSGYCFVANQGSRSVAVVSLERFRVTRHIALDAAPAMVLSHPREPKVLVLTPENGTVHEIDAATFSISRRARVGGQAVGMQLAPANNALWVLSREPSALVELPLDSLKPGRRVRLPGPADAFDLVLHKKLQAPIAVAASRQDRTIILASLSKGSIDRTVAAADEPSIVRFRADGAQLIAGSWRGRSATIVDTATGKTVVRLPLPLAPRHFCTTLDGGQLFITGDGMDAVTVVFPYSTEVYQTILAGRTPGAMAVTNPDTSNVSYLMVSNADTNSVTVLDYVYYTLVALVQVGQGPGQILLTADDQYALVLNEKSGDLAVIRVLALSTTPNGGFRRYKSAPLFTLIPVGEKPVSAALVT